MSRSTHHNRAKSQALPKSTSSRALLQYKNGFFQGYIDQNNQRQGRGVYFWNTGEIYYGDWNQDHMEGEGIFYFALGGYVYGTFLADRVHGYAILCFSNGDYTAGFWERGILNGKVVQHSRVDNDWSLEDYKEGNSVRVLMKGKGVPPFESFSMIETYSLKKLLDKGSSLFVGDKNNKAHLDFLAIDPDGWYHGNIKAHNPHGLGIVCYSEHKNDRGLFKEGALNGLGRSLFTNGDVYDGFYKEGKFHGIGVYFKSETEQYLYGMYESNECVQALTLGNGYPHELMRTLKADFRLDLAELVDKETETEVLTLSCDEQLPCQEQEESSIHYEESTQQQHHHQVNSQKKEERRIPTELSREDESVNSIQDSQISEKDHRRAVEYEKARRQETHSSHSSKKSKHEVQATSFEAQSYSVKNVGSRKSVQEEEKVVNTGSKAKLKNSISHGTPSNQSEFLVARSEVLEQKSNFESPNRSVEKNSHDSYMSKGFETEKEVSHTNNSSYLTSPQKDYHSGSLHNSNYDVKDCGLQSVEKPACVDSQRLETFHATGAHQWESPPKSHASEGYVARTSEMIEKISTVVPYEPKSSHSPSSALNYAVVSSKRNSQAKSDHVVTTYTVEHPTASYNYDSHNSTTTYHRESQPSTPVHNYDNHHPTTITYNHENQPSTAIHTYDNYHPTTTYNHEPQHSTASYNYDNHHPTTTYNHENQHPTTTTTSYNHHAHEANTTNTAIPGIDVEVKKIMDKIFTQTTNTVPTLNIAFTTSIESGGTTQPGSALLSSPGLYSKPEDRSPTFAQSSPETKSFDYKQYTGSHLDGKDNTTATVNHLTTDWGLRIFPSLDTSLVQTEYKKPVEFSQATASFGLIPSAPSEESMSSKMYFAGQTGRHSQASNTFLDVDFTTRDRAVTGKFGGSEGITITVPETIKEEYHVPTTVVEPSHKSYNFTGQNLISTSYDDIDAKTYLKAKTPINKKIEHSKEVPYDYLGKTETYTPYSATDYAHTDYTKSYDYTKIYENLDKSHGEHHLKSTAGLSHVPVYESPSGRASITSKTDTWSIPTVQKITDNDRGSFLYNGELNTSHFAHSYALPADLVQKRSSLYEPTSEILDNGSISNRYNGISKDFTEKKYEIPMMSVPISHGKLDEDLYKSIMMKLELLVKEQCKATEVMEDVKRSLHDKIEAMFREERKESDTFKILLNHRLDELCREKSEDLSTEQLAQIQHELNGNHKQVNAAFSGVNKKLDLLLLKQGRLNVETEDSLVRKLESMMTKHQRHASLQVAHLDHQDSIGIRSEDHARSLKSNEGAEKARSEIFIADSSAEYNVTHHKKSHHNSNAEHHKSSKHESVEKASHSNTEHHKSSKHESVEKTSHVNSVTSNKEHKKESKPASHSHAMIKEFTKGTELTKCHVEPKKKVEHDHHDLSNISDDTMDYASVASDSAPLKVINCMTPKSKALASKNEHTITQHESELRHQSSHHKQKSEKEVASTPKNKPPGLPRSQTPTPQSRNHTENSHRNFDQARSPRPVTSQNASMVIDTQPPTQHHHHSSNQRDSHQSSKKVHHQHHSPEKQKHTVNKDRETSSSPVKDSAHWHVVPLCAQDSLFDEPEEIIEEEGGSHDYPSEERRTQPLPSPGNFTGRSHMSKGQKKHSHNNHNRASSISSQSSYNVFDLKSHRMSMTKSGEQNFKKGAQRESRDFHAPHNTSQSVFDNFIVTSNNNDIEYVRVDKNSSAHRNMSFMTPCGPKLMTSAKKQSQREVDLYEEEGRNKRNRASKEVSHWRNEEEGHDSCSTGRNIGIYMHASPVRVYKDSTTPRTGKSSKTVCQEGRMGSVRWRLEIEDMATERSEASHRHSKHYHESERRDEYDSYEMREHCGSVGYDKKTKSISAMNSPLSHRKEFDHLMRTVNVSKDIGTYENNMYSPCKDRPEDANSSHRYHVKVPSLHLGHDAIKGYEEGTKYYIPSGAHNTKHIPGGYGNLTISHDHHHEVKY